MSREQESSSHSNTTRLDRAATGISYNPEQSKRISNHFHRKSPRVVCLDPVSDKTTLAVLYIYLPDIKNISFTIFSGQTLSDK